MICVAVLAAAALGPRQAAAQSPAPASDTAQTGRLGIADAVAMTVARHPDIARAYAEQARGSAELALARSVWMPQVSYQANLGPNMLSSKSGSGLNDNMAGPSIMLNQFVWDFGRAKGQIGSASAIERQRGYELEMTADQLAAKAALAFLDVMRFELQEKESREHIASLRRLRDLIRLRADAGISDQADLLLAEVRVESALGEEIQARTALTKAQVALANLTGVQAGGYDDPSPLIGRFADHTGQPDFNDLPAVAAADEAEQAATSRIAQARAERMPRLGVQLGYTRNNYTYNTQDNALTAMMTVTGDLYRAGTPHLITAAEQERRAARATKDSAILEIRGRIMAAREEMEGGRQRVEASRQQERQAVITREIFLEQYKLGKRSLSDLLNAEVEIYRAASSRITAESDILRARVQFEASYGSLRPSLGLAARMQQAQLQQGQVQ